MKKIGLLVAFNLVVTMLFAQHVKLLETELLKVHNKMRDADDKHDYDLLDKLNNSFGQRLQTVAERYPATIAYPFKMLQADYVRVLTSADGLFRIYSWDTMGGGTMHEFASVYQYKTGAKTKAILDTPQVEGNFGSVYNRVYTLRTDEHTYYLAVYLFIESTRYNLQGIRVFSVENEKLNQETKIIKTQSGMHSELNYEYDLSSLDKDPKLSPDIAYDTNTKTIRFPVIIEKGVVTKRQIVYKFNGRYFEKVKS